MEYNRKYARAFCYGMMLGKDVKPGDEVCVNVTCEDDVLLAVKKAYIDMTPRTFSSGNEKKSIDAEKKEALLKMLANRICSYMKNGSSDFDTWHKETCELFLNGENGVLGLIGLLKEAKRDESQATFGKAQKIVNMTFKYLYCFDDAETYINKFEPCHMPLDSYILDWVFSWYACEWKERNGGKKLTKGGEYKLTPWSNLKYEMAEGEIIPQYKEIQDAIKKKLDNYGVIRLEAEFLIWYEARNEHPYTYK